MLRRTTDSDHRSDSDEQTDERTTEAVSSGFDRRSYLRLASATLVGAAAVGASGAVAGAESGEIDAKEASGTLTVGSGDSLQVHVGSNGDGDYGDLENVLIDITASGADVIITTHGGDWTIRNVGVKGESNGGLDDRPMIGAKTSGSGLIENVYLGDGGAHGGHGPGRAGVHVARKHSGTVTIRNLYVANWTDNGVYGSSPGKSGGGGGDVRIEKSYGENNNIANFRIGTPGSVVEDSVSVAEGTQKNLNLCRGVWCRHRDGMVVSNTDIDLSGPSASGAVVTSKGGSVTYKNSDYSTTNNKDFVGDVSTSDLGTDPSTSPPSGVPTSAEEAAGGSGGSSSSSVESSSSSNDSTNSSSESSSSGDSNDSSDESGSDSSENTNSSEGSSDLSNEIIVVNHDEDTDTTYRFEVSGEVEPMADPKGENVDGSVASGHVHGYKDGYTFSGEVTSFEHDGPATVLIDGEEVDPDSF